MSPEIQEMTSDEIKLVTGSTAEVAPSKPLSSEYPQIINEPPP
jgi:hypothetical protein